MSWILAWALRNWPALVIAAIAGLITLHAFNLGREVGVARGDALAAQARAEIAQIEKKNAQDKQSQAESERDAVIEHQAHVQASLEQAEKDGLDREQLAKALSQQVQDYQAQLDAAERNTEELKQRHDETIEAYQQRIKDLANAKPHKGACVLSDADVHSLLNIK